MNPIAYAHSLPGWWKNGKMTYWAHKNHGFAKHLKSVAEKTTEFAGFFGGEEQAGLAGHVGQCVR